MSKKNILAILSFIICVQNSTYAAGCNPPAQISPEFLALGPTQEIGGLIWSSAAPVEMNHSNADTYCAQLSSGARLPTSTDYLDWSGAIALAGPGGHAAELEEFKQLRMTRPLFWSSTLYHEHQERAFYFDLEEGILRESFRKFLRSVRCVIECS